LSSPRHAGVLLLVGTLAAGCAPQPDDGAAPGLFFSRNGGPTSEIHGQVVSYPDGEPIPEMSVVTFDVQARYEVYPTDEQGRYSATGLTPGFYRVKAWPVDGQNYIGAYYHDTYFYCTGRLVDLRGGAVAEGVDFRLPGGGAIEGTITDALTGEPMENVRVEVRGLDYYNNNLDPLTHTDADGFYRVVGLDSAIDDPETMNPVPGNYELKVTAPGRPVIYYPGVYSSADAVPVGATRGQTSLVNLEVPAGGVISGTVFDGDELPVDGGIVKAVHVTEPWIQSSVNVMMGDFAIGGLAPGTYTLEATAEGFGAVKLAELVELEEDGLVADVPVELAEQATVSGTLLGGGTEIEAGIVQAVPVGGVSATAMVQHGGFGLEGLGAGDYYFYALPDDDRFLAGYVCGSTLCASTAEADLVPLAAGDHVDLGELDCPGAATIAGTTAQREGEVPLGRIYVTALPEEEGLPSSLATSLDEDGSFVMGGLRPGSYTLSAEPYRYCSGDPGWVTTYSGDARRPETATVYELAGGDTEQVALTLPTDADGDGMSDIWEWLHFLDPARSDELEDPDLDGVMNLDEYLERTDPRDDLGEGCATGSRPAGGAALAVLLALAGLLRTRRR